MAEAVCRACLQPWDRYRRCGCEPKPEPYAPPPHRTVNEALDLETVDEDGPEDDPLWLGEEELPF